MIKKNTKIIIEGEKNNNLEALQGGIPLSKGEIIKIHDSGKVMKLKTSKLSAY